MVYDSVHVFARGLEAATLEGPELRIRNLSCEDELPWKEGSTLYNYLAGVNFRGLTGPVRSETDNFPKLEPAYSTSNSSGLIFDVFSF